MSATPCPPATDQIAAHIQEFAAGHGVLGYEPGLGLEPLWAALRTRGITSPGLVFAAGTESAYIPGGSLALTPTPIPSDSPDLATLVADLECLHPLFDRDRIAVTTRGSSSAVTVQTRAGGPTAPDTVDACFALLCGIASRLNGSPARPLIVSLRRAQQPAREDREAYRAAFDSAPVAFSQPSDRCVFVPDSLLIPMPDSGRRSDRQNRPWSTAVSDLLSAGRTRLPDVARTLMISMRTLQLRLNAEDRTFAGLLDATQHAAALALLARPELPITSIAGTVGFATPSAFARAVRRWTGMTPSKYRTSVLSGGLNGPLTPGAPGRNR